MDHSTWLGIAGIAVCILFSAYFSATETAFSSLNRVRLKSMEKAGDGRAHLALTLSGQFDQLLSTILIGNNIVNILSASLATTLFLHAFGDPGVTLSTVVMTVVVLIFGEVCPKSLAKESPERFAMFSAPIIRFFMTLFTPLNLPFTYLKKLLSKMRRYREQRALSRQELLTLVEEAEQEGGLAPKEGELIRSAIEFRDRDAGEILIPRVDVCAIDADAPPQQVRQVLLTMGYSRLPVYEGDIDHVIGVLHARDFHRNPGTPVRQLLRPALCVSPAVKISALLGSLQAAKSHLAVVVDEFGATAGIVTIEDIVEELVGDIWDEYDQVPQLIRPDGNGFVAEGGCEVEQFLETLQLSLETQPSAQTVNGLLTALLGHIPRPGESVRLGGYQVSVLRADGKRALEVRAQPQEALSA